MLEFFAIYMFCKKLGTMLRAKGRSPLGLQILFVFMWFTGEILGGILAAVINIIASGNEQKGVSPLVYLGALIGAAACTGIVFFIAHMLSPVGEYAQINAFPVQPARPSEPANPYSNTPR